MFRITDTISLADREIHERFVRAAGPRGQNARNEATAVELRFDVGASSLAPDMRARLMALGGRAIKADGVLVVVSRIHPSQAQNRQAARRRFVALVARAAKAPELRKPASPDAAERRHRRASKEFHSAVKRGRHGPIAR